jgi:hypothetical protein
MSAGELTGWLAAALTLLTFTGAPWQRLTQLDAGLALAFLLRSVGVRRHIAGLCPRRGTTKREAQDRICFNAREAHVTDQPSCIALEPPVEAGRERHRRSPGPMSASGQPRK